MRWFLLMAVFFLSAATEPPACGAACEPLGLPLAGPVTHKGETFALPLLGCRYHDVAYSVHSGVDFPVDELTEVLSTLSGEVVWAGARGGWGNVVVIENEMYQTWYAHNKYVFARTGDRVSRGDLLALSGNTGASSGPHIHYGTKLVSGWWMNPERFFDLKAVMLTTCGLATKR